MAPTRCWTCHGKKPNGKTCGYGVPIGETACNSCGHEPPIHVSCPAKAGTGAASSNPKEYRRKDDKPGSKKRGATSGTDKLQTALAEKAAADLKAKETAKALVAANAQIKQLKATAVTSSPLGTAAGGQPMDLDLDDAPAATLVAAITQAREELKQLQDCSEFYKSLIPDFATKLVAAQAKLDAATAARRAADPLKKQLEGAEGHQTRMAKKLSDAKAGLDAKRQQLAEAQAAFEKQQGTVAEAEANAAKAVAEVAGLAARFASERSAAPAPPADVHAEATPASPGFVSVAFAEEKWAEREASFTQQLAQLQAIVATQSEVPSEAGDLELEHLEEDEAWSKVEKGRRKGVLRKQRETLATRVRAGLGKVSTAASPFKKT
jgi:hypothetical protein